MALGLNLLLAIADNRCRLMGDLAANLVEEAPYGRPRE